LAVKIVRSTLDECISRRLIDPLGKACGTGVGVLLGVEDPNPVNSDEKNPLAWWDTAFSISAPWVAEDFSEPTVYTHRATSALM
jgi:hypothetical protein